MNEGFEFFRASILLLVNSNNTKYTWYNCYFIYYKEKEGKTDFFPNLIASLVEIFN